jgi:hypothetical protein
MGEKVDCWTLHRVAHLLISGRFPISAKSFQQQGVLFFSLKCVEFVAQNIIE